MRVSIKIYIYIYMSMCIFIYFRFYVIYISLFMYIVDMENVTRIQHGQMTVAFQKAAKQFSSVKQNSFSIIYQCETTGTEKSLDLIAPTPDIFRYWFDGLKHILKRVRYMRDQASLDERFYKMKFELADKDRGGTLDRNEVLDVIASMNNNTSKANVIKMFLEVDVDKSNNLDFDEFVQLMTLLRRRPELESIWSTICDKNIATTLAPLTDLNMENNDSARLIRNKTITIPDFMEVW